MGADHAGAQREVEWLVAVTGAVKLLSPLFQCAGVVHGQLVAVFALPPRLGTSGSERGQTERGTNATGDSGAPTLGAQIDQCGWTQHTLKAQSSGKNVVWVVSLFFLLLCGRARAGQRVLRRAIVGIPIEFPHEVQRTFLPRSERSAPRLPRERGAQARRRSGVRSLRCGVARFPGGSISLSPISRRV